MFYVYDPSTHAVTVSSTSRQEAEAYQKQGQLIVEQAEVDGNPGELLEVNGVITLNVDPGLRLAAEVRKTRNRLIAETDWWATSDRTMTSAQARYRQDLRDITAQAGFPTNVNWPTKP